MILPWPETSSYADLRRVRILTYTYATPFI